MALDPGITATADIEAAIAGAEAALLVVPAQFLRGVIETLKPHLRRETPVLHCAKGIETGSLKTMSEADFISIKAHCLEIFQREVRKG